MLDVVTLWDATHMQWCKEYELQYQEGRLFNSVAALIILGTALDVLENLMDDPCIAVMGKDIGKNA